MVASNSLTPSQKVHSGPAGGGHNAKHDGGQLPRGHTNQRSRPKGVFDILNNEKEAQGGFDLGQHTVFQLGSVG